jgi:hypothetical protein
MLMRNAVVFFVLLLWPLSLPSAASAAPLSLYGPFDQKHYGTRSEPDSSPEYGALSGAGGAATTIRKLTSAKDQQICVKGRLLAKGWIGHGSSLRFYRITPAGEVALRAKLPTGA